MAEGTRGRRTATIENYAKEERIRILLVEDHASFRQALAEGLESREIAEKLNATVETERTHMVNILHKLGVHSRLQALVFAARYGVVQIR